MIGLANDVIDIFLQPGEVHFGRRDTRIRTLLGSCVSMVMWHPQLQAGGMCHYMLPAAAALRKSVRPLDGRYADEALELLMCQAAAAGVPVVECEVKLFGGADMFHGLPRQDNYHVGLRNVEAARRLVHEHGLNCVAEHMGGAGHRKVIFDVASGRVWMKQEPLASQASQLHVKHDAMLPWQLRAMGKGVLEGDLSEGACARSR